MADHAMMLNMVLSWRDRHAQRGDCLSGLFAFIMGVEKGGIFNEKKMDASYRDVMFTGLMAGTGVCGAGRRQGRRHA